MLNQTDRALHRLCIRLALNEYLWRTSEVRQQCTTQLFVAYGKQDKGKPISKQRLFKWLVEYIKFSYTKNTNSPLQKSRSPHPQDGCHLC